jgi:hypothetical protein
MQQLSLFDEIQPLTLTAIHQIFIDSYSELKLGIGSPPFHVEFYPFVGINHTIRIRNQAIRVRLCDLFEDASRPVIKAISIILLSKLFRRRLHPQATAIYQEYISSRAMKDRATHSRQQRGRKMLAAPEGQYYNLAELYRKINALYFDNTVSPTYIGWSRRKSLRILGHFDPSHNSITISRWFDQPHVPEFVISFILFHEMLHARFSTSSNFDLKLKHGKFFKEAEKQFPFYDTANLWLKENL